MSVKILTEDIKNNSFSRLYYIYGEEEYLKQHYFSEIKRLAVKDFEEFNYTEFDNKNFSYIDFCNAVNSYPVMIDHKVVAVIDFDNSSLNKSFSKEFIEFLKNIPEFCTVVFLDTSLKKTSSTNILLKTIDEAKGISVDVKRPTASGLVSWVKRHFKSCSKDISTEDIQYLLSFADNDMLSLNNEISKLCGFVESDTITRNDIDNLVTPSIDANRFEIADAFYAKKYSRVFEIVDKLYKQNIDEIAIANVFYRTFLDMWRAYLAYERGKVSSELAKDFGLNPYAASKVMKNIRTVRKGFLRDVVMLSYKLDKQLKSAPFNKRDLVVAYIADVIDKRQNYE